MAGDEEDPLFVPTRAMEMEKAAAVLELNIGQLDEEFLGRVDNAHLLDHPGAADLTAHVDFATLAALAAQAGVRVQAGSQGGFLTALGIDTRARALSAAAPERAKETDVALRRLTAPEEMGELFKVMALTGGGWPEGAGLEAMKFATGS